MVRKAAGIDFAGWDPTTRWIIAEVEMEEVPEFGLRGGGGIGPAEDGTSGRDPSRFPTSIFPIDPPWRTS